MNEVLSPETLDNLIDTVRLLADQKALELTKQTRIFEPNSLKKERLKPSELGLLRVVSWFYVLYFETGKINIEFLVDKFSVYNIDPENQLREHLRLVHNLRTFFQHNLDITKERDSYIHNSCIEWFAINTPQCEPLNELEWQKSLTMFLQTANTFMDGLLSCLNHIADDESCSLILKEWELRRNRSFEPHDFDSLIRSVAADMGRNSIDAAQLRKRFYEKWMRELNALTGNFEFKVEARKLIEHTLLNEITAILPITGQDILDVFDDIKPGPEVGKLLKTAKRLYEESPCTKVELLERLKKAS